MTGVGTKHQFAAARRMAALVKRKVTGDVMELATLVLWVIAWFNVVIAFFSTVNEEKDDLTYWVFETAMVCLGGLVFWIGSGGTANGPFLILAGAQVYKVLFLRKKSSESDVRRPLRSPITRTETEADKNGHRAFGKLIPMTFWSRVAVSTVAGIISSIVVFHLGFSNEITLFSAPVGSVLVFSISAVLRS